MGKKANADYVVFLWYVLLFQGKGSQFTILRKSSCSSLVKVTDYIVCSAVQGFQVA